MQPTHIKMFEAGMEQMFFVLSHLQPVHLGCGVVMHKGLRKHLHFTKKRKEKRRREVPLAGFEPATFRSSV